MEVQKPKRCQLSTAQMKRAQLYYPTSEKKQTALQLYQEN